MSAESTRKRALFAAIAIAVGVVAVGFWASGERLADETATAIPASARDASPRPPGSAPPDELPARAPDAALAPTTVWVEVVSTEGAPVVGAVVRLIGAAAPSHQRTDEDGLTRFEQLRPGSWRVDIRATGYAPFVGGELLRAGLKEAAWTFRLSPEGQVRGLRGIVTSAGKPVAGALVSYQKGGSALKEGAALSGEDGRFVLARIDGADKVFAFHEDYGPAESPVADGGDVVLALPAPGFVEGRVTDDKGRPLTHFKVQARLKGLPRGTHAALIEALGGKGRQNEAAARQRLTFQWTSVSADDDAGQFRLGPVPAGLVTVVAAAEGRVPAERDVSVSDGGTARGVELRLMGPLVVTGCVRDASSDRPISGARVEAQRVPGPTAPGFGSAVTDDDGCYRLLTAAEVRHSVGAHARGYVAESAGGVWGRADDEVRRDFSLRVAARGKREGFRYVGIGARLSAHDDGAVVAGVFDSGSAAGALQEGDVILRVDGVWTERLPLTRIVEMIVGEDGTEVELLVQPKAGGPPRRVSLARKPMSSSG